MQHPLFSNSNLIRKKILEEPTSSCKEVQMKNNATSDVYQLTYSNDSDDNFTEVIK
jgi:hypothetical protein